MLGLIVSLIIVGLVAGALARLAVPGRQDLSIGGTIVLGIVGSFVGGFLGYLLFHHDGQDGFIQPVGHLRVGHRLDHRVAAVAAVQRRAARAA